MMDSNENRPLTEVAVQEAAEVAAVAEVTATPIQSKEDVIARLQALNQQEEPADKTELDALKQTFYRLRNAEVEAARKSFEENGGNPEAFVSPKDESEIQFKEIMGSIKEKLNALKDEEEQEKLENLEKKLAIIERMKELAESPEEANKAYNEFKKLQAEWNEIKNIPAAKVNEIWKSYQLQAEKFYDLLKLNHEFREYDFKKNLEAKTRLCEAAERLADEEDVISAFHQLQKLHQEFREIGPVSKELREEVWNRFKAASTVVNKRHQQHFEDLKQKENENLEKKTALCEAVESIDYSTLETYAQWNDKTQEIIALQEEWKTIGFAPQKMNNKIFERFRAACDAFFQRKAEFYKGMKDGLATNLERKIALCEKAEALKDSTDWKATADKLAALQREWKTIGPVPKKMSDAIWKRFNEACDAFFDKRKVANSSQRTEEQQNLAKKKAVIEALAAIDPEKATSEDQEKMHSLIKEWNSIGHVPFRDKDKIYKQYKALIDALFNAFHQNETTRRVAQFKESIKEGTNIARERERLLRIYDNMCSEIKTYENNLGFLTSSSKSGNSLVAEMQRKMEKLKAEAQLVLKKISALEEREEKEQK